MYDLDEKVESMACAVTVNMFLYLALAVLFAIIGCLGKVIACNKFAIILVIISGVLCIIGKFMVEVWKEVKRIPAWAMITSFILTLPSYLLLKIFARDKMNKGDF